MSEIRKNVIITFANQKGGVGKSTLCALFAHYLSLMGHRVKVIDADRQQSLTTQRLMNLKSEQLKEPEVEGKPTKNADKRYINLLTGNPWEIIPIVIKDAQEVDTLMQELQSFDGVVLIDSPGSLTENGIVPMTLRSDFIITPFFFEMQTLVATAKYLVFVDKLRRRFPQDMRAQVILLPNRYKSSVGTKEEKLRIERTILSLRTYGKVAPDIKDTARIQYYTTTEFNLKQKEACENAFKFILNECGIGTLFSNDV